MTRGLLCSMIPLLEQDNAYLTSDVCALPSILRDIAHFFCFMLKLIDEFFKLLMRERPVDYLSGYVLANRLAGKEARLPNQLAKRVFLSLSSLPVEWHLSSAVAIQVGDRKVFFGVHHVNENHFALYAIDSVNKVAFYFDPMVTYPQAIPNVSSSVSFMSLHAISPSCSALQGNPEPLSPGVSLPQLARHDLGESKQSGRLWGTCVPFRL